jgi:hypothetical protein
MWHTPEGMRVLRGCEGRLFRLGVRALARRIHFYHGRDYFGRLTANERLLALAAAARALLEPSAPFPGHTAWNEAAVYAVYYFLGRCARRSDQLRRLVWKACRENGVLARTAAPIDRSDPEEVEFAIECLADRILWDRDWELEEEFCNPDGEEVYFTSPPVATPARVELAKAYIAGLGRGRQRRAA